MRIAPLLLALLMPGCASISRQASQAKAPAAITQLGTDLYRIDLAQPTRREPSRAEDFALLRASELAIEKGFTHFAIVDIGRNYTTGSDRALASLQRDSTSVYGIYGIGGQTFDVPRMTPSTRQITVQCLNDPPPELLASNARNIEKSVREKYGL